MELDFPDHVEITRHESWWPAHAITCRICADGAGTTPGVDWNDRTFDDLMSDGDSKQRLADWLARHVHTIETEE
jgi:hypothetical protein